MRVNHEIRVPRVRVIGADGEQLGVLTVQEARYKAQDAGLDLVEIVPNAEPPVCKIVDYGKFRYDQTKREKENKKSQHQVKVKEVKVSPNIGEHDLDQKLRQAIKFLGQGNKVKFSCYFRGREMMHRDLGHKVFEKVLEALGDAGTVESVPKMFGRMLTLVVGPPSKKKK